MYDTLLNSGTLAAHNNIPPSRRRVVVVAVVVMVVLMRVRVLLRTFRRDYVPEIVQEIAGFGFWPSFIRLTGTRANKIRSRFNFLFIFGEK